MYILCCTCCRGPGHRGVCVRGTLLGDHLPGTSSRDVSDGWSGNSEISVAHGELQLCQSHRLVTSPSGQCLCK